MYGVNETEAKQIDFQFNDDPTYTCESLSGHNTRPDAMILQNKTTCQLKISKRDEYSCTIRISPEVYDKSCILTSQSILVDPLKGKYMANFKDATIALGVTSGALLIILIILIIFGVLYITSCYKKCQRQGNNQQVQRGKKTVKVNRSIYIKTFIRL